MKNTFKITLKNVTAFFKKHAIITVCFMVIILFAIVIFTHFDHPSHEVSQGETSTSNPTPPEPNEAKDSSEESPESVEHEVKEKVEEKTSEEELLVEKQTEEKKKNTSSSQKNNSSSESKKSPSNSGSNSSDQSETAGTNKDTHEERKESWLDTSNLTFTEADVGKIVGYDSSQQKNITIVKFEQGERNGRRYIILYPSNGIVTNEFIKVECEYCHGFPCPNGGGKSCREYDIKKDPAETCQQCGRPRGDGYNGTCHQTIDWDNGGTISCNHYD